jgi:hypothetical protein
MTDAERYAKELDRIMEELEQKAKLAEKLRTKKFLKRALAVGLRPKAMMKLMGKGGLEGLVTEVHRREAKASD